MMNTDVPYQRWAWVELTGFDNEAGDYGVEAYLENAGFIPDAISLLLYNPDFIHTHDGLSIDRPLPFDVCSYGGHPTGQERQRQDWTRLQLKGLIDQFHKHGIAAYFAVFDQFVTDEWIGRHRELLHVTRARQLAHSICPWKRFRDGTYYEDFFAQKLGEVLVDYGFDGFHQADGYCHPRLPIYEGDFSDDIVDQFVTATGVSLPDGLEQASDDDPETIGKRAEWIWRNARQEWIGFYARRVAAFCRKVADAVHARGKRVILNNAMARDPFQALYRYGVDYQAIAKTGIDGFIVETVAPGVSIGGESGMDASPHYDFLAMLMLIKSYVPDLPLLCLNSAHDVNEQWDVLRHGPALIEREIYCKSNMYRRRPDGELERCSAGPVVCLADGIQRHEWEWFREWWDLGFTVTPQHLIGATLVWSDRTLKRQLDEFIATRRWTTHKLLHELMSRGAPVHCAADVTDLGVVEGPILVLHPQLFPEDELETIQAYAGGPIITIGTDAPGLPAADFCFEDSLGPEPLQCRLYGVMPQEEVTLEPEEAEGVPEDLMGLAEPPTYPQELYFRQVSDSFLSACAQVLSESAGATKVVRRADVIRVQTLELADDLLRLIIGNDHQGYVITTLDVGQEIESATVVTRFPGSPPGVNGSELGLRIPGRGAVVVDVTLKR